MPKSMYRHVRDQRKGESSMSIEPMTPGSKIEDRSEPEVHTESLVPPKKPGMPDVGIKPMPVPNPNKHTKEIPTNPDTWMKGTTLNTVSKT